jgi:hypothetical protein
VTFKKGTSGNPAGKKPGTLNGTTVALKEQILHALDQAARVRASPKWCPMRLIPACGGCDGPTAASRTSRTSRALRTPWPVSWRPKSVAGAGGTAHQKAALCVKTDSWGKGPAAK